MDKLLATNSADNAFNRGVDSASGLMHRAVDSAADAAAPALQHMAAGALLSYWLSHRAAAKHAS
jgi:hypothetical protein